MERISAGTAIKSQAILKRGFSAILAVCIGITLSFGTSLLLPCEEAHAATKTPSKVKSVSISKKTTSSVTVKYSKSSKAKKYQIAYKKKSARTWTYKTVSQSTRSYTIKKLSSNTTYQVKVRGINGSKKGKWSSTKTVTTKKPAYTSLKTAKSLNAAQSATKMILVNAKSSSSSDCIVQYFKKSSDGWKEIMRVNGVMGKNGINKTKEGDGKTPTGLYHFTKLFGIKSNPGTQMPYTKLTNSMYWCGSKAYYNQFVDESKTAAHKTKCNHTNDEHLKDYAPFYNYAAALSYNSAGTYKKGSAIFLHCKKSASKYTAGCVAVSESDMKKLIKEIDEDTIIIIDKYSNITNKKY